MIPVIYSIERTERFYEAYKQFKEILKYEPIEVYAVQELSRIYEK
jgi:hypothetical protein